VLSIWKKIKSIMQDKAHKCHVYFVREILDEGDIKLKKIYMKGESH